DDGLPDQGRRQPSAGNEPVSVIPLNYVSRTLSYLKPYWRMAAGSVLLTILASLASLLTPWPLQIVVDHVLEKHPLSVGLSGVLGRVGQVPMALLITAVVAGLLIALTTNSLHVLTNYVNTKIDQHITLDFRSQLFLHAQRMSLAFHDHRRSGMLIYMI